jgi:hypothetical protein
MPRLILFHYQKVFARYDYIIQQVHQDPECASFKRLTVGVVKITSWRLPLRVQILSVTPFVL